MEVIVVTFAVAVALVALGIAALVLIKVVKMPPRRRLWNRLAATPGLRWVVLGLSATMIFGLLNLSVLIPVLITIGGITSIALSLRKRDNP